MSTYTVADFDRKMDELLDKMVAIIFRCPLNYPDLNPLL